MRDRCRKISFLQRPVGTRTRSGSDLIKVAYRGDVAITRRPATGRLDDAAVEILTLERSATARNMMLAIVRPSS